MVGSVHQEDRPLTLYLYISAYIRNLLLILTVNYNYTQKTPKTSIILHYQFVFPDKLVKAKL